MKVMFMMTALAFLLGCTTKRAELNIRLLNNYEFSLDNERHTIDQFSEVFATAVHHLKNTHQEKYDVVLQVHENVSMKTLQLIKVELSKVKEDINEIRYSHE